MIQHTARNILTLIIIAALTFACTKKNSELPLKPDTPNNDKPAPADTITLRPYGATATNRLKNYHIVWQDEFDVDGMPNMNSWWYETGGNGWGNNEKQYYVGGRRGTDTCAVQRNGILTITAKQVGDEVLSVRMNTQQSWTYGYFEARLKLPKGKGTWPAFWMMPKESDYWWPECGEIDIMEHVGYDPDVSHATIHCNAYNHKTGQGKGATTRVPNSHNEFHIYAMEWTPDYIHGFVDGKRYFTFMNDKKGNNDTWPFTTAFYLKLNLAWGGWGGAMGLDYTCLPASYEIDWVRVFSK